MWQKISRTDAAVFTLGGAETNYCLLSTVLLLANNWQWLAIPVTDSA
jgi:hypothetical protein